jgi:phage terminase small subunit
MLLGMGESWHKGLSEKRRRFCEAYSANGGNAVDAARKAGYAKPDPEGARLLGNARIRQALESLRESTTDAAILTREARQKLWTKIALDESEKVEARLRASELLGKSQGDFLERHEVEQVGPPVFNMVLQGSKAAGA